MARVVRSLRVVLASGVCTPRYVCVKLPQVAGSNPARGVNVYTGYVRGPFVVFYKLGQKIIYFHL